MIIYVGNLSLEVTEDELRLEFVAFGAVKSISLMNDQAIGSGQGRGCGYVEMVSAKEGESAIEALQGKLFKGRKLDVIQGLPITRDPYFRLQGEMKISGFDRKARHGGSRWP